MNYTIMEKIPTGVVNGVMHYRVTIVCDTASDVPQPDTTWAMGSIAQICEPHGYKILNSEGSDGGQNRKSNGDGCSRRRLR